MTTHTPYTRQITPYRLDHLVYATPDLNATVRALEMQLGVRASEGGQHPGLGTRNALLALGERMYLEIVGPDPEQPAPDAPRWFGIDTLDAPRLVAWCAAASDLDSLHARAAAADVALGAVRKGGRVRPDGVALSWYVTTPPSSLEHGVVPFFIDWLDSPHPAESAASGVALVEFAVEQPNIDELRAKFDTLNVSVSVRTADAPSIVAVLEGPGGRIVLR